MDDYISKPIIKEDFYSMIRKFSNFKLYKNKEKNIFEVQKDIKYNIKNVALEMELTEDFLKQLLDSFFDITNLEVIELQKVAIKVDYKKIYQLSHSIKGSASNLRLEDISKKANEIEQYSKNKNYKVNYLVLIIELCNLIDNYKKELS